MNPGDTFTIGSKEWKLIEKQFTHEGQTPLWLCAETRGEGMRYWTEAEILKAKS